MNEAPKLCKYHSHVECEGRDDCKSCGWNPIVEAARLEELEKHPPVKRPSKRAIFTRWWQ